ncbi:MAG: hypothetical protein LC808_30265 [Actinobacteria bacterium]|nr:hypothetical protein [Actinomycetota bacterium]
MTAELPDDPLEHAFADQGTRDYLTSEYVRYVQDLVLRYSDTFSRLLRLTLVLMVAFMLITFASIERISVGGLEVRDLSIFQKLLPVVVAFMYSELIATRTLANAAAQIRNAILLKRFPLIHEDVLLVLNPQIGWNLPSLGLLPAARPGMAYARLTTIVLAVAWFSPYVFTVYAYVQLFALFGFADLLVWISLLLSCILMIQAVTLSWILLASE